MQFKGGQPLDLADIQIFQRMRSIQFPKSYIDIVSRFDGASLSPYICRVADPVSGEHMNIGCNSLIPFRSFESYEDTMEKVNDGSVEGLPAKVIAFGSEAGGILFAFDYRGDVSDDPLVVFFAPGYLADHEIFPAAPSFSEFIDNLKTYEESHDLDGHAL